MQFQYTLKPIDAPRLFKMPKSACPDKKSRLLKQPENECPGVWRPHPRSAPLCASRWQLTLRTCRPSRLSLPSTRLSRTHYRPCTSLTSKAWCSKSRCSACTFRLSWLTPCSGITPQAQQGGHARQHLAVTSDEWEEVLKEARELAFADTLSKDERVHPEVFRKLVIIFLFSHFQVPSWPRVLQDDFALDSKKSK